MTINYSDKSFLKLLFRWKGSVWKDIIRDYCIFLCLYFAINLTYRFGLHDDDMRQFEKVVRYFRKWNKLIPIQFLIGFYVSNAFSRWWQQFRHISFPDKYLVFVVGFIHGSDEESKRIRHTLARYVNLINVMIYAENDPLLLFRLCSGTEQTIAVWKEISVKIKKRFPTDEHLLRAGLMTDEEFDIFKRTPKDYGRWYIPVSWSINLLAQCKEDERIDQRAYQKLLDELYAFRGNTAMLTIYDWINIPLVYTQVVTLGTYGYFLFCLISRQNIKPTKEEIDLIFPLFTTLEFIFYLGWMKVGEDLRCPFGEDDEDFDMNFVLDRNMYVSSMIVDELHRQRPRPESKVFEVECPKLPHTKASYPGDKKPKWRLAKMKIKAKDMDRHDNDVSDSNGKARQQPQQRKGEKSGGNKRNKGKERNVGIDVESLNLRYVDQ